MDATRLATLLTYCRIDNPSAADEALLESLYDAATSYMFVAGVAAPTPGTARCAQFDMCVNAMVLDAWDTRRASVNGAVAENPAFRRILNQLKFSEPVPNSGTGDGASGGDT